MILIINKSKKEGRGLSDMLYYMGILAHAATPIEATSEISTLYKAAIIMNPNILPDKEDYVARLRSYVTLPIFAITDAADSRDGLIFDGVISRGAYASKIFERIAAHTEERGLPVPGEYRLAGIDASVNLRIPMYFDRVLPFTKTETMILRTLIATYPTPTDAKKILKYAFRPSKTPELSNIRTHVSVMNKKFRDITERNIIQLATGEGYRILTPEIKDALLI